MPQMQTQKTKQKAQPQAETNTRNQETVSAVEAQSHNTNCKDLTRNLLELPSMTN